MIKKFLSWAVAPALALALAIAPLSFPIESAQAAASTQAAHAVLCLPQAAGTGPLNRRIVVTSSTATTQPVYILNGDGCSVVASGDIGFFLAQGAYYGANIFTLIQTGITATTTASTSLITLPAGAVIDMVVLAETAGNSITGGIDIGDSGSSTAYASAVTLNANTTVAVADSALTRLFSNSGTPAADQILVACHTSCNSGSITITIIYSYF